MSKILNLLPGETDLTKTPHPPAAGMVGCTFKELIEINKHSGLLSDSHTVIAPASMWEEFFDLGLADKYLTKNFYFVEVIGFDTKTRKFLGHIKARRICKMHLDKPNWTKFMSVDVKNDFRKLVDKKVLSQPWSHEMPKGELHDRLNDTWRNTTNEEVIRNYEPRRLTSRYSVIWAFSPEFEAERANQIGEKEYEIE